MNKSITLQKPQNQLEEIEKQIEYTWAHLVLLENRRQNYLRALNVPQHQYTETRLYLSWHLPPN